MISQFRRGSTILLTIAALSRGNSSLGRTVSLYTQSRCKTAVASISRQKNTSFRLFNSKESQNETIDKLTFNNLCAETLDSLSEYFEELIESTPHLKNADVTYSDGVLTVYFGQKYGTYVINRQTPNLQIWLSSPISGPKRYDFLCGTWVYKHDKTTLHSLLDIEIRDIANREVDFEEKCSHAKMKV